MKIYISGKITRDKNYKAKFERKSQKVAIIYPEAEIVNPIEITNHLHFGSKWSEYLKVCIRELTKCDTIYMLKDWINSEGAKLELCIADKLGLEIIFE